LKQKSLFLGFLIVTLVLSLVGSINAQPIFSDDFEGTSPWDETHTEGQGSSYTYGSTDQAHHGSKSGKAVTVDYNGLTYAVLREGLGTPTERYFRAYLYLPSLTLDNQASILHMMLHSSSSPTIWCILGIGIAKDGTTPKWRVRDGVNGAWEWISTPTPQASTWFCVELYVKKHASEGALKIWINNNNEGSPDWSKTELDTSGITLGQAYLGIIASAWSTGHTAYHDCVVIDDAFIGIEEEEEEKSYVFSETIQPSASLILTKELQCSFMQSVVSSSQIISRREKRSSFMQTIVITSQSTPGREKIFITTETVIPSASLNVAKELMFLFEHTFFEKAQASDSLNIWKALSLSFVETIEVTDSLNTWKALKLSFMEFVETITVKSKMYSFFYVPSVSVTGLGFAMIALIIALLAVVISLTATIQKRRK